MTVYAKGRGAYRKRGKESLPILPEKRGTTTPGVDAACRLDGQPICLLARNLGEFKGRRKKESPLGTGGLESRISEGPEGSSYSRGSANGFLGGNWSINANPKEPIFEELAPS